MKLPSLWAEATVKPSFVLLATDRDLDDLGFRCPGV